MRRFFVLLLVGFTFTIFGCGDPSTKLIGTWQGSVTISRPPTGNPDVDARLAKITKPVDYTLVLNKDKTYNEQFGPVDKITGTWAFEKNMLTLTPQSFNGNDPADERRKSEEMMSRVGLRLPLPEGQNGPESATVADDFSSISLPSVGATAVLKRTATK